MKIRVTVGERMFAAEAEIAVTEPEFSFSLPKTLTVCGLTNNAGGVQYNKKEEFYCDFMPSLYRYTLRGLAPGSLTVEYRGRLSFWFYFKQTEIIHFSLYNAWYPVIQGRNEQFEIELTCPDDYFLLGGEYDAGRKIWLYNTHWQRMLTDPNIILLNRKSVMSQGNPHLTVYYFDKSRSDYVGRYVAESGRITGFLCDLYGSDRIDFTNVVFLPPKYRCGGYRRDRLVVFSEFNDDFERQMHGTAHELAHSYACGADTGSWEDWLNETCAEWSALLYELKYNPARFDTQLEYCRGVYRQYFGDASYPLKQKNSDARPSTAAVHYAGVLIFDDVYEKYGAETIARILRIFDTLPEKNTRALLDAMRSCGLGDAADIIAGYIV